MYLDSATHKVYIKKPIDVSVTLTVIRVVGHCNSRVMLGILVVVIVTIMVKLLPC